MTLQLGWKYSIRTFVGDGIAKVIEFLPYDIHSAGVLSETALMLEIEECLLVPDFAKVVLFQSSPTKITGHLYVRWFIRMYYLDNQKHRAPCIHVYYQGDSVIAEIPDGRVLEGCTVLNKRKRLTTYSKCARS